MARIKSSDKYSKKEMIVNKAAFLFRKNGFDSTSMRELAENIGVEAPSLYNHIGSKNEILQKICFDTAELFNLNLDAELESKDSAQKKLENLIRFHIQKMIDNFDEVYVSDHEWRHLPDPLLTSFLNQRKKYEEKLVNLVKESIKNKELKNIDPYVAVLTILSAVRGLQTWQKRKRSISAITLENDMVEHLLNGLKK
ncbi:MAG: TetR/AcrR family transcriptional regulator [Ferruginibacter sp.]